MRLLRRYNSTIYGKYRHAGLRGGLLVGATMAVLMFLSRFLPAGQQPDSPENLYVDLALFGGMLVVAYRYRKQLPMQRVTLKELMLLGLWCGLVAAAAYAILLWAIGGIDGAMMHHFTEARRESIMNYQMVDEAERKQLLETVNHYTPFSWAIDAGFTCAVMSIIFNLLTALIFRTEKAPIRQKNNK